MKFFNINEVATLISVVASIFTFATLEDGLNAKLKAREIAAIEVISLLVFRLSSSHSTLLGVLLLIGAIVQWRKRQTVLANSVMYLTTGGWILTAFCCLFKVPGFDFGLKTSAILNTVLYLMAVIFQILAAIGPRSSKRKPRKTSRRKRRRKKQETKENDNDNSQTSEPDSSEAEEGEDGPTSGQAIVCAIIGIAAFAMFVVWAVKMFSVFMP